MEDYQSLKHTRWDCKYHVIWIPKCRRKVLYGQMRKELGAVLRDLARRKRVRLWKEDCCGPCAYVVFDSAEVFSFAGCGVYQGEECDLGYIQGRKKNFTGENFWARGYFVSTTGLMEETFESISSQEEKDKRLDQLKLFE